MSPGRLEAFSDGVFAIAITLLVLDIHVPDPSTTADLAQQLGSQWPSYVAYGVSFLTIGIIWINHHAMLRRIKAIDHEILILNLLLLLCVGLLPFTTALMAAYLKESEGETLAAAIYAGSFLLMSVVFAAMNWGRRWARWSAGSPGPTTSSPTPRKVTARAGVRCPQLPPQPPPPPPPRSAMVSR